MILFGNEFVYDAVRDITDGGCIPIGGGKWRCVVDSSFLIPIVGEWISDGIDFFAVTGRYMVKKRDGYYFYMVVFSRESVSDVEKSIWGRYVSWVDVAGGRYKAVIVDVVDYVMWDDLSRYLQGVLMLGWGVGRWDVRYNAFL